MRRCLSMLVGLWLASPVWGATTANPSLPEVREQVSKALRGEATATTPTARVTHALELVTWAHHLQLRPERKRSPAWQRTYRRVVARLRSIGNEWKAHKRRQRLEHIPKMPQAILAQVDQAAGRAGIPVPRANAVGPRAMRTALADQLIAIIERTVSPNVWASRGGTATISYWPQGSALVIRAPQGAHERIAPLLGQLRR